MPHLFDAEVTSGNIVITSVPGATNFVMLQIVDTLIHLKLTLS